MHNVMYYYITVFVCTHILIVMRYTSEENNLHKNRVICKKYFNRDCKICVHFKMITLSQGIFI